MIHCDHDSCHGIYLSGPTSYHPKIASMLRWSLCSEHWILHFHPSMWTGRPITLALLLETMFTNACRLDSQVKSSIKINILSPAKTLTPFARQELTLPKEFVQPSLHKLRKSVITLHRLLLHLLSATIFIIEVTNCQKMTYIH